MILSARASPESSTSTAQRAKNPQSWTVKINARNNGRYGTSNGQLMKTLREYLGFGAFPSSGDMSDRGLLGVELLHRRDRLADRLGVKFARLAQAVYDLLGMLLGPGGGGALCHFHHPRGSQDLDSIGSRAALYTFVFG